METLTHNTGKRLVLGQLNAEVEITKLMEFYKTHLAQVKDVRQAISDLRKVIPELEERIDTSALGSISHGNISAQSELKEIFATHFPSTLLDLYKKQVEYNNSHSLLGLKNHDSAFMNFLELLSASIQGMNKKYKLQAEYEVRLLKYIEFCLMNYGLHPKIESREEKQYKKFNLLVKHNAHSRTVLEEHKVLLSWNDFQSTFVEFYKKRLPIKMGGKIIPFDKIVEVKITTTKLKGKDELQQYFRKKGISILSEREKNEKNLITICNDETDKYLPNPYSAEIETIPSNDAKATKIALLDFPNALKIYNDAVKKFNDPNLTRNCLDDLRLCLETLLKEKLKNTKSLENQVQALGKYIKDKNGSSEITDLLHKVVDFYTKYQNNNVKHNNNAKQGDAKFIFNLTSTLIIHLSEV